MFVMVATILRRTFVMWLCDAIRNDESSCVRIAPTVLVLERGAPSGIAQKKA